MSEDAADSARPRVPDDSAVTVGVIGCGYWGPHLVRNLLSVARARLVAVADPRLDRLSDIRRLHPDVAVFADHRDMLSTGVDAVVIASPIHTHHAIATDALRAGKHVLVEKPLAACVTEAAHLIRLARRRRLVLMAGHTFVYHPAIVELRRLVRDGELGRVYHADASRLNLGLFQRHANVAWDLAPHDISILVHVLGQRPSVVSARGSSFLRPDVHDVCYLELLFPDGASANVHVSWLGPDKVRLLTLVGDRQMAVFDDVSPTAKLRIYDRGVERFTKGRDDCEPAYRRGQIVIPHIEWREPLLQECEHFVRCVLTGRQPVSDGEQGLAVVATLEAADRSLRNGGVRVPVEVPDLAADAVPTRPHRNGSSLSASGDRRA